MGEKHCHDPRGVLSPDERGSDSTRLLGHPEEGLQVPGSRREAGGDRNGSLDKVRHFKGPPGKPRDRRPCIGPRGWMSGWAQRVGRRSVAFVSKCNAAGRYLLAVGEILVKGVPQPLNSQKIEKADRQGSSCGRQHLLIKLCQSPVALEHVLELGQGKLPWYPVDFQVARRLPVHLGGPLEHGLGSIHSRHLHS